MLVGSAPISADVLDFLKVVFCCPVTEGYGMTESGGGSAVTFTEDPQTGVVGGPIACVKIRLRDLPEMNYLSTDEMPQGEILFKGPGVTPGYFKNKQKTEETIIDGWMYSGDVGRVYPNGAIKVIDRAKNIFKLSQGEYIAPEKLENIFIKSKYIAANCVYGDSIRDFCILFVVLDLETIKVWCDENGKELTQAIVDDTDLIQVIYDDVVRLAGENQLNSLEKPKQMHLVYDPWTDVMGILTPTSKLKRSAVKAIY